MTRKIFISSVQKELQEFRDTVYDYVTSDPLLKQFFTVFQFEKLPAADRAADDVYLEEVTKTDIYLGLFANEYGWEDDNGLSPIHREFIAATSNAVYRLIYLVDLDGHQHPKMKALIDEAGDQLIRRRVHDISGLLDALYHSLVEYLGDKGLINTAPFDKRPCGESQLEDISGDRIEWFVKRARAERGFPLGPESTAEQTLTHLNQLSSGFPTNSAMLLFGEQPQKFLPVAEVKCAHHHGTNVQKPIPDYKVFGGDLFAQVDDAVDFVMSKLARSVGTRSDAADAPVDYEIPREVIAEAIVNAVAHRDYTSAGAVQVAVFANRIEVRNPGRLPAELTIEQLAVEHTSYPRNSKLAEGLFFARYIEKLGTGTLDMIRLCAEAGIGAPKFDHDGTEFVVTVPRHDRKRFEALGLNDRQIEIMVQVRIGGRITNSEVQALTGAGRKTAGRDLDELVEPFRLLERKGKGRGTHYVEAK